MLLFVVLFLCFFYLQLDAERENPRSQQRLCGDNVPHMWTQSLFIVGQLLRQVV